MSANLLARKPRSIQISWQEEGKTYYLAPIRVAPLKSRIDTELNDTQFHFDVRRGGKVFLFDPDGRNFEMKLNAPVKVEALGVFYRLVLKEDIAWPEIDFVSHYFGNKKGVLGAVVVGLALSLTIHSQNLGEFQVQLKKSLMTKFQPSDFFKRTAQAPTKSGREVASTPGSKKKALSQAGKSTGTSKAKKTPKAKRISAR